MNEPWLTKREVAAMTHSEQRCGDRVIVYRCPKHGYTTQANPVGEDARCGVMVNRTPGETCYELVEGPWDAVIQEADCTPADTEGGERLPACGGTGLLAAMSPERHGMDEISRCPACYGTGKQRPAAGDTGASSAASKDPS